jgi:hypothetical protein
LTVLRGRGLKPRAIQGSIGVAGGLKWLILSHVDCFLFGDRITGRRTPRYLVGSASGS